MRVCIGLVLAMVLHSGTASASNQNVEHFTLPENEGRNLPFSDAVRVGDTIYLSGQIGVPPGESAVVSGGVVPESVQTLKNIGLVLSHFGLGFENIVKCQVMLLDIAEWPAFNDVYKVYFQSPYPARSAFAGSGLALNARVELECIAIIPQSVRATAR